MIFKTRYKTYGDGSSLGGWAGMGAMVGNQLLDTLDTPNQYGHQSKWGLIGKGAMSGAATGMAAGPWGAVAGAVLGAVPGIIQAKQNAREESLQRAVDDIHRTQMQAFRTASVYNTNPEQFVGNGNTYYGYGGRIRLGNGGGMQSLSSETTEVTGPSHEQGGIDLPAAQANVEGNETINNGYVFSDRLGFAQLHKPIAKAIGRIESKPPSPERVYSLQKLREQEEKLKQMQEYLRNSLNLK